MGKIVWAGAAAALLLAGCAHGKKPEVAAQTAPKPALGAFGLDETAHDPSVKPGDDFFSYASGGWMKRTQIPNDRTRWGSFNILRDKADADVREIAEEAAAAKAPEGSNTQKIGDFYSAYLDVPAIDAKGLEPAQAGLQAIAAAKTSADIARLIGRPDLLLDSPIAVGVTLDEKNPNQYVVGVSQGGLGLPEREYYLKQSAEFKDIRSKYLAHIARMLELAGVQNSMSEAQSIVALETSIAQAHWPIAKRRERNLTYNPKTEAQLISYAPAFPWKALFETSEYGGQKRYVVAEADAIPKLAKLFKTVPVSTWRAYLAYHYLTNLAPVLPKPLDDENFSFYGQTLNGQPEQLPRWKRAATALNGALGEAVGEIYVQRRFKPEAKAQMVDLVENLRRAYAGRIQQVQWMSEPTKKVALEKLAAFRPKIGYPDKWRDYSALEIKPGDAFGNAQRAAMYEWRRDVARLGRPADRDEWFMNPQTVNAYYNPVFNEVVFPAAILQPPFFDPEADPAVNYGGIGGVIGHEMGHGFDDQGAKSDAKGVLRTWWAPKDEKAFQKLTQGLVTQYDAFEPLPGLRVNGRLTLGENIGDLGGLTVAHEAYLLSLDGKPAPIVGGWTGDQRFFLSWAQVWRSLIREQSLRNQVMTNVHSPERYRVNGVVRNVDAWYSAFDVQPGDKLYLPPQKRVSIW